MQADRRSPRIPTAPGPVVGLQLGPSCNSKSSHEPRPLPASRAKRLPNNGHSPYQRLVVFSSSADKPLWFSDVALLASRFSLSRTGHLPFMPAPPPSAKPPIPRRRSAGSGPQLQLLLQAPPHPPLLARDPFDIISPGRREEPRIELVAGNRRFQVCLRASLSSIPSSSVPPASLLEDHEGLLARESPRSATLPLRRLLLPRLLCFGAGFFPFIAARRASLYRLGRPRPCH